MKKFGARFLAEFTLSGRARSFAEFTLSQLRRFFASLRMTGEGLRMTSEGLGMTGGMFVTQNVEGASRPE